MKRIYSLLLILALIFSFSACEKEKAEKYCSSCGMGISKDAVFCEHCGAEVLQPTDENKKTSDTKEVDASTSLDTSNAIGTTDTSTTDAPTSTEHTHTHNYEKKTTAPTCTIQGYSVYTCTCGHSYISDYIPALNHNYKESVTPPTCSAQGCTSRTCSICGHSYTSDYVPALNHNYKESIISPTCSAQGYTSRTCSICGHSYTSDYVPALNHNYKEFVTPPTCTAKGYTSHTCSICGHSYKDSYTNASHSYVDYECSSCGQVDKSHAYEYLIEWVKKNGKVDGTDVVFSSSHNGITYDLFYDAEADALGIDHYQQTADGYFFFFALFLDDFNYGASFEDIHVLGYIDPATFTQNSPITYDEYVGPDELKSDMLSLAQSSCCTNITWLELALESFNLGITIKDLGFLKYVSET